MNVDDLWTGISLSLKEMQEWVRDWRVYPVSMALSLALWVCQLVHHILKTTKSMLMSVSQLWCTKSRLSSRSSKCFVRACTLQHWFNICSNIGLQPCSWRPTVLQSLANQAQDCLKIQRQVCWSSLEINFAGQWVPRSRVKDFDWQTQLLLGHITKIWRSCYSTHNAHYRCKAPIQDYCTTNKDKTFAKSSSNTCHNDVCLRYTFRLEITHTYHFPHNSTHDKHNVQTDNHPHPQIYETDSTRHLHIVLQLTSSSTTISHVTSVTFSKVGFESLGMQVHNKTRIKVYKWF